MHTRNIGERAPDFRLPAINGQFYTLESWKNAAPLILALFKVTCPACQLAMPYLERLYQEYKGLGVEVWGIAQDPIPEARTFAKDYKLTFPVLCDVAPYPVSDAYGIDTVPTIYLLDGKRKTIIYRTISFLKDELNELAQRVAEALGSQPIVIAPANDGNPSFKPG